jgi:hypothetical protein
MVHKVVKIGTVIACAIVIVIIGIWYLLPSYMAGSTVNANKLEILGECLRSGGTEIIVEDGLVQSRAFPDTMLNEDQLKAEWESHIDLYEQDCYYRADLTPQQVEEIGQ